MPETRVLFVCLGNICRSPTAEGVFRHHVRKSGLSHQIHVDSAGTGAWHIGEPPDPRAIEATAAHDIDISHQSARQVTVDDIRTFDHILAMDKANLAALQHLARQAGPEARTAPVLFLDYANNTSVREVPDPYYEGNFDAVVHMIDDAAEGLLEAIKSSH